MAALLWCYKCKKGLCAAHAPEDQHPCLTCGHYSTPERHCTTPSVAMCPSCEKGYCGAHLRQHTLKNRRSCQGYKTIRQKLVLTGKIPDWTFTAHKLRLPPKMLSPHIGLETTRGKCPRMVVEALQPLEAQALLSQPSVSKWLLLLAQQHQKVETLELLQQAAVLMRTGCLGPLYVALCESKELKSRCVTLLKEHLEELHEAYREAKEVSRMGISGWPETQDGSSQKSWSRKVLKLSDLAPVKDLSGLPKPEPVLMLDMRGSSWFAAMTRLKQLRKQLNAQFQRTRRPLWHLSVLHFKSHWVFAVNQKNWEGAGTTRILWPLTTSQDVVDRDDHDLKDCLIRVLDLSYPEVAWLVCHKLSPLLGGDAKCAQAMLDLLDEKKDGIPEWEGRTFKLGLMRCALLKGMRIQGSKLEMDSRWWLTRKSRSAKNLDAMNVKVSAYAALCNVLSILFIAEPRHALSMFPCTRLQLEGVARKSLTFQQVFSSLGGVIRHGRLLPGANVLGPALLKQAPLTTSLTNVFQLLPSPPPSSLEQSNSIVVKNDRKRMAMPLVDSPLHALEEGVEYGHSYMAAVNSDQVAKQPEYQPLMKVLFTILLEQLGQIPLPEWVDDLPAFEEDHNLEALELAEEAEHQDGLEED